MKLSLIETGYFKLDGGAMFGVVPKVMWEKAITPDENNKCTWSMRCLLIEHGNQKILVDTGMGDKQDEKFRSHFEPSGNFTLLNSLAARGIKPEDITDVILTHLHFDHVGGALTYDKNRNIVPTFPNAIYWSNEEHYNWAIDPNPREKASFLTENIVPLKEHGVLKFVDIIQGVAFNDFITFDYVYGHTGAMMIPTITLPNQKKVIFTADLLPSSAHVSLPWVMAYDVQPLKTLKEKEALFEKAADGNHYLIMEHDKEVAAITLVRNEQNRVVVGQKILAGTDFSFS